MGQLKLALRTLTRTPFVTTIAVLSLAFGIGANAAIFSMFDQILIRSLPVQAPEELVNLSAPGPKPGSQSCGTAGGCDVVFSYPMFRDLERAQTGLAGIAAHRSVSVNVAHAGGTTSGRGMLVSGSYFPVLGVQPELGRLFGPADDERIGEHYVAVLGYDYWENQMGRDAGALNSTIVVNGQPLTVVGVAARGFKGTTLGTHPDIYVPITMRGLMSPGWVGFENRRSYWAYVFARVRPGATLEQASSELNAVYTAIVNDVEVPLQPSMTDQSMERFRAKQVLVEPGHRGQSGIHEDAAIPIVLLMSITGLVLVIACANIANLLLARGAHRAQEIAIRGSLGASRRQLLGQLLTESVLLAGLGGLASLLVARWTLAFIVATLPAEAAATLSAEIGPGVLLFTGALSIVTGVVFGMYPALHSTRSDLVAMLKAGGGQPASGRAAARFRSSLVTVQIALSMGLLVAAGLFVKSLRNVSRVDLGLDIQDVVAFGISPALNGYEPERSMELFRQVEEALAALPGVSGVTASVITILAGSSTGTDISVEGFQGGPGIDSNSRMNLIGPSYFSTFGVPLIAGREFTVGDTDGAPRVAIVNEAFTRKFDLNGAQAVGKFMSTDGGSAADLDIQIVGVVRDAAYSSVKQTPPPTFVTPYRQAVGTGSMTFYARTSLDPGQLLAEVPRVVEALDPSLPVEELKTLEQQVSENVYGDRIITQLSAAFSLLATLLAAMGLYGVLAYTVAQRAREIGVRMALGAGRRAVRGMVLKQVGKMTAIGGVLGLVAAYALGRLAQSLLFGMEGADPVVMGLVGLALGAVAFTAGYIPALRASNVDPIMALRYE